jgi:hypothetical protein
MLRMGPGATGMGDFLPFSRPVEIIRNEFLQFLQIMKTDPFNL